MNYKIRTILEADQNHDGKIDSAESNRAAQKSAELASLNGKAVDRLMSLDGNADGEVNEMEIAVATERVFIFVDTDKDGLVNSEEICIARARLITRKGLRFGMTTCF